MVIYSNLFTICLHLIENDFLDSLGRWGKSDSLAFGNILNQLLVRKRSLAYVSLQRQWLDDWFPLFLESQLAVLNNVGKTGARDSCTKKTADLNYGNIKSPFIAERKVDQVGASTPQLGNFCFILFYLNYLLYFLFYKVQTLVNQSKYDKMEEGTKHGTHFKYDWNFNICCNILSFIVVYFTLGK